MVQRRRFLDLLLDEAGVHTPEGTLRLERVTRAQVVRNRSRGTAARDDSVAGAVGGSLLGGAVAGPAGFIAGGLIGASSPDVSPSVPRTVSATLILESPELAYTVTVGRDQVVEAEEFAAAVKREAGSR